MNKSILAVIYPGKKQPGFTLNLVKHVNLKIQLSSYKNMLLNSVM